MRQSLIVQYIIAAVAVCGWLGTSAQSFSLAEALVQLEQRDSLRFSYEHATVAGLSVASIDNDWISLRQQLPELGVQYKVEHDGTILLAPQAPFTPPAGLSSAVVIIVSDGQQALTGATVSNRSGGGYTTDIQGCVVVPTAATPIPLTISYLGYAQQEVWLREHKDTLHVLLRPDTLFTQTALVIGQLPSRTLSKVSLSNTATQGAQLPRLELPATSLQTLGFSSIAGVSRIDARSTMPAIRGSLGSETRIELDGLPLYQIDHLFGLFPAINPQAVQQIELYRSHYPVDRGGSRGGLLHIQSLQAAAPHLVLDVSQLAASATAQVQTGAATTLVSARSSFGNIAEGRAFDVARGDDSQPLGLSSMEVPDFTFGDIYVRTVLASAKSPWSLTTNAFASSDSYNYSSFNDTVYTRRQGAYSLSGRYNESSDWGNLGFGASLKYTTSTLLYQLRAHHTQYERSLTADSRFELMRPRLPSSVEVFENRLHNEVNEQQVGFEVQPFGKTPQWFIGVQVQRLSTQARFDFTEVRAIDQSDEDWRTHAYAHRTLSFGRNLNLKLGLRGSYSTLTADAWLSPRGVVQLAILPGSGGNTSVNAGYSYLRQSVRSLQHENQFGQTYEVLVLEVPRQAEVAAAENFTLGFAHERAGVQVSLEGYYRRLPGVLAAFSSTVGVAEGEGLINPQPTFLTASGEGEVLGLDIDVHYQHKAWNGSVAYTLAKSRQRFNAISANQWQRAPDDRRHRLAFQQSYQPGRWTFTLAYEAASGLVYNDLAAFEQQRDRRVLDLEALQTNLPPYHRLDLGSSYRFEWKQRSLEVGLKLFNVFDRFNVSQRRYVLGLGQLPGLRGGIAVGQDVSLLRRLLLVEAKLRLF